MKKKNLFFFFFLFSPFLILALLQLIQQMAITPMLMHQYFFNPKDTGVTKGTCHVKSTLFSLRDCNRWPIAMGTAEASERRLPVIG